MLHMVVQVSPVLTNLSSPNEQMTIPLAGAVRFRQKTGKQQHTTITQVQK